MKAIIDTSSLIALTQYYLPFDRSGRLTAFIQAQFESGELVVIDEVAEEGKYIKKKLISKSFKFIYDQPTLIVDTSEILPGAVFYSRLENDFCNKQVVTSQGFNDAEFESEKARYLGSADAHMILYAMSIKSETPVIVTEETANSNDNKPFKKIPAICKLIGTDCCAVPAFLQHRCNLELGDLFS